ncbi:methyltransferase [Nonomuraea ceibae]|uniref:methyltransferase n=1 Tax=Nonomuraea ceibae TaxID=1935170 RepID=UPI001C5FEEFF|nr:methyltransferase [Nonomuraea ceibae]
MKAESTDQPTDQAPSQSGDLTGDRCDDPTARKALPRRTRTTARAHLLDLDELDITPFERVQYMMNAVADFAALHAAVYLGVFELLSDAERSCEELAEACQADPRAMRRLMRWLHGYDFVAIYGDRYQLTDLGQVLTAGAERSQRHAVLVTGSAYWQDAIGDLAETIRRGHPQPSAMPPYEYLAVDGVLGPAFDRFMDARSAGVGQDLAALPELATARTAADLGGGLGGVLARILHAHPGLQGILVDRPDVVGRARGRLEEQGVAGRVQFVACDLFDGVPGGAQVYLLSSVLHNLSDERVMALLTQVRRAMRSTEAGSEVWIVEGMLPRLPGARSLWYSTDMRMLALFPGDGVRTSEELARLVRNAGLRVRKTSMLPCGQSLMVAQLDEQ